VNSLLGAVHDGLAEPRAHLIAVSEIAQLPEPACAAVRLVTGGAPALHGLGGSCNPSVLRSYFAPA
jgi:hypothetical protein